MSTLDVPGSNPANADQLRASCWAEHEDGSLIYVKGTEGGQVVYEIYDMDQDPVVYYQDAMREDAFKKQFSFKQGAAEKWTWHDKQPMPWDRVIKSFDRPTPQMASAEDTMSAAARVAESLKLRAKQLHEADVAAQTETVAKKGRSIMDRIAKAVEAFSE